MKIIFAMPNISAMLLLISNFNNEREFVNLRERLVTDPE